MKLTFILTIFAATLSAQKPQHSLEHWKNSIACHAYGSSEFHCYETDDNPQHFSALIPFESGIASPSPCPSSAWFYHTDRKTCEMNLAIELDGLSSTCRLELQADRYWVICSYKPKVIPQE